MNDFSSPRLRFSGGTLDQIEGNTQVVNPGDSLQAAYDKLKSSANDGAMGTLAHDNRRALILAPGQHIITSVFPLDTSYVDITSMSQNKADTVILMEAMAATLPIGRLNLTSSPQPADAERPFLEFLVLTGSEGDFDDYTTDMCVIIDSTSNSSNYDDVKAPIFEVAVDGSYIVIDFPFQSEPSIEPSDINVTPFWRSAVEQRANHISLSGFTVKCNDQNVLSAFGVYNADYIKLATFADSAEDQNNLTCAAAGIGDGVNAIGTTASIFGVGIKQAELYESPLAGDNNEGWHTVHFSLADRSKVFLFDADSAVASASGVTLLMGWFDNTYNNMAFESLDDGTGGGWSTTVNISVFGWSSIHGTWKDCTATGAGWSVNDYQQLRADMLNCKGGNKAFGNDYMVADISGNLTNCVGEEQAFGGCGVWGCNISGTLIECLAGPNSFAMGRIVQPSARLINCLSGDLSFAGGGAASGSPGFGELTIATVTWNSRSGTTDITVSTWTDSFACYKEQEVYVTGTGVVDGYYTIHSRGRKALTLSILTDITDGAFVSGSIFSVFGAFRGYARGCNANGAGYSFGASDGPDTPPAERAGTLIDCSAGDINSTGAAITNVWRDA